MTPTPEQDAIATAVAAHTPLRVIALAGTGKTSTLALAAERLSGQRVLYLAYNRAVATDARRRFPAWVEPRTAHSLAFAAAVGFGCWGALRWHPATAATVIVVAATLLVARLVIPLGLGRIFGVGLVLAAGAGWWAWTHPWPALPAIAAAGVVAHLLGDAITVEGVPFLWPVRWRAALPLVGHTSSMRETILGTALSVGLVALTWVRLAAPALSGVHLPKLT